jgi:hypothetical protein
MTHRRSGYSWRVIGDWVTDQIGSGPPAAGSRYWPKASPGAACATLPQIAVAIVRRHLAVGMIETALVTGQRLADNSQVAANQKPRYGVLYSMAERTQSLDQTYWTAYAQLSVGQSPLMF